MSNGGWFVVVLFAVSGLFSVISTAPWWLDRAIVEMLRTFRIFAYPNAIRLAVSLERDEAQWEVTSSYLTHPEIGSVKVGSVDSVCVHLDDNSRIIWTPNWIERRIIHDALKQAIHRRINCHLNRTLPASAAKARSQPSSRPPACRRLREGARAAPGHARGRARRDCHPQTNCRCRRRSSHETLQGLPVGRRSGIRRLDVSPSAGHVSRGAQPGNR